MRLTCIICRELLLPSEDINAAPCGHFFHYPCWVGWLERSQSCPQCRKKTTERQLVRLYFNVAEGEGEEIEDAAVMNHKLDSMAFNLRLKDKDLTSLKEQLEKETKVNEGLRSEIKRYKKETEKAEASRHEVERKCQILKMEAADAKQAKEQVASLRIKLDRLQRMDTIIHGNVDDVQQVLDSTTFSPEGMRSLALFTASLKKAVEEAKEKREQLKDALNADKDELRKMKKENRELKAMLDNFETTRQHQESDIRHLEQEKKSLSLKLQELEKSILSPSSDNIRDKALRRLIAESPAPEIFKRLQDDLESEDSSHTPVMAAPGRSFTFSQSNIENQPVQRAKRLELDGSPALGVRPLIVQGSSVPLKKTQSMPLSSEFNNMSIFNKRLQTSKQIAPKRPTSSFGAGYDGMGGHSHVDEFPLPNPKIPKKAKQTASSFQSKVKKISAPPGVPKLNHFSGFI